MNKPVRKKVKGKILIPVREFAASLRSRRGYPVSVQWIYKMIKEHKTNGKPLSFQYKEINKGIWIVK